jgi:hypothetical protein
MKGEEGEQNLVFLFFRRYYSILLFLRMEGITQQMLATNARYVIGYGILLADDFLAKVVPREDFEKVNTKAAYIVRIRKPQPAWFFLYGISISFVPHGPVEKEGENHTLDGCGKIGIISRTLAENWALSNLMYAVDKENKYKVRVEYVLIDLKETEGVIKQIPKDEDVVRLHWAYQLAHAAVAKKPYNKIDEKPSTHAEKKMDMKMRRGLRTLDRRRWTEAGLVPPPERTEDLKKIISAVDKKYCYDPSIDHCTDEEEDKNEPTETLPKFDFITDKEKPPPSSSSSSLSSSSTTIAATTKHPLPPPSDGPSGQTVTETKKRSFSSSSTTTKEETKLEESLFGDDEEEEEEEKKKRKKQKKQKKIASKQCDDDRVSVKPDANKTTKTSLRDALRKMRAQTRKRSQPSQLSSGQPYCSDCPLFEDDEDYEAPVESEEALF